MNIFIRIIKAGIFALSGGKASESETSSDFGLSVHAGGDSSRAKDNSSNVSQSKPRRFYVYVHLAEDGTPFYIGKGTARRAWKNDKRHPLWHRYVDKHLGGKYSVKILEDNLGSDEAEYLENDWMSKEADTLVNWVSFGRKIDYEATTEYWDLRKAGRTLAAEAKELEKDNPEKAVELYSQALRNIKNYAYLTFESGLVGQLIKEEKKEKGVQGDIDILNRLTICLVKLKRNDEARAIANQYFDDYRSDANLKSAENIKKRIR